MFVKILSRKNPSYRQLAEYILKDRRPSKSAKDIIKHNIKGSTIEAIVKEFERNETFRTFTRKDQVAIYHEIISLSSNEEHYIPDEVMLDLTQKYIELRGLKAMCLAALHRDTEHCHAHIMTSALDYATGKAHRISKSALQDIKLLLQEYHLQKYPEITESYCDHRKGRTYAKNKEYQRRHKEERTKLKETVQQQVLDLFKQAKTFDDFIKELQINDLHHYERKEIAQGIIINDTKIRFTRLGIEKEELESLKLLDPVKNILKEININETININKMNITNINFPMDTDEVNYRMPLDEFDNYIESEMQKIDFNNLEEWANTDFEIASNNISDNNLKMNLDDMEI